jgi:hypothetical protein
MDRTFLLAAHALRTGLAVLLALPGGPAACAPRTGAVTEIALPAQTLRFRPSRDDVTVRAAWLQVRCVMPPAGAAPAAETAYRKCQTFSINGREIEGDSTLLELTGAEPNTAEMDKLRIEFSGEGSLLCIALRAILREVPHNNDVDAYAAVGDRASLVSYCSGQQPASVPNRFPFEQNRVGSIAEFVEILSRPIEVKLKPGPLPRQPPGRQPPTRQP